MVFLTPHCTNVYCLAGGLNEFSFPDAFEYAPHLGLIVLNTNYFTNFPVVLRRLVDRDILKIVVFNQQLGGQPPDLRLRYLIKY